MPASPQIQPTPTQSQMLAEAYRRGLLRPAQAAAYEAAALRGAVDDPYAVGRADERASASGASRGASLSFTGSIPFLNEGGAALAAGAGALGNMMNNRPADFGGQWTRARALQQGYMDQFGADHPIATTGLRTAGLAGQVAAAVGTGGASEAASGATAAGTGLAASARRLALSGARNATLGGGVAAVNAAAQPGTLRQRAQAADNAFLPGAAVGAAVPMVASATPGSIAALRRVGGAVREGLDSLSGKTATAPQAPSAPSPAGTLAGEGIPMTLGQQLGGKILTAENQTSQLPYLGAAIRAARTTGQQGLARALANRALAEISETLPAKIPTGRPTAEFVNARVAAAQENAPNWIDMVEPDELYARDVQKHLSNVDAEFPDKEKLRNHFASAVTRVGNTLGNGYADGDTIRDLFHWLDGNIDDHIDSPTPEEDAYSRHLQNFKDSIAALAGRQNAGFMDAYTGAEKAKVISGLLSNATERSGGNPNGFDPPHLLEAYGAMPPSHVSDLAASAMPTTLDFANRANAVMSPPAATPGSTAGPTMLGAGLSAAAIPNAVAGRAMANAFETAPPGGIAQRVARLNAFIPDVIPGLTAASGLSVAAASSAAAHNLVARDVAETSVAQG
jgi:hypothetical protein